MSGVSLRASLFLLLSPLSCAFPVAPSPSSSFGLWRGWGVSLAWYANVFGPRSDTVAAFFSLANTSVSLPGGATEAVPGLGFTIARYNAGASGLGTVAGRAMAPSPNAPAWKLIDTWWPGGPNTLNASADANQVAYLLEAEGLAPQPLTIEVFSNSPPWWALVNANPCGSDTGATDNLLPAMRATHAAYLAAVAQHLAQAHALPVATVEAFNEPSWNSAWKATGTQEGCHFDIATQALVLPLLRPALDAAGLRATRVAASDESLTDQALATWRGLSSGARAAIDAVNVHGYQGLEGNRSGLYAEVVVAGGKELRMSEHGEGDGSGGALAQQLLLDFTQLHMTSWCYWQAIDEAGGWGFFVGDMGKKEVCVVLGSARVGKKMAGCADDGCSLGEKHLPPPPPSPPYVQAFHQHKARRNGAIQPPHSTRGEGD